MLPFVPTDSRIHIGKGGVGMDLNHNWNAQNQNCRALNLFTKVSESSMHNKKTLVQVPHQGEDMSIGIHNHPM